LAKMLVGEEATVYFHPRCSRSVLPSASWVSGAWYLTRLTTS
jgi:hypothetical protein